MGVGFLAPSLGSPVSELWIRVTTYPGAKYSQILSSDLEFVTVRTSLLLLKFSLPLLKIIKDIDSHHSFSNISSHFVIIKSMLC